MDHAGSRQLLLGWAGRGGPFPEPGPQTGRGQPQSVRPESAPSALPGSRASDLPGAREGPAGSNSPGAGGHQWGLGLPPGGGGARTRHWAQTHTWTRAHGRRNTRTFAHSRTCPRGRSATTPSYVLTPGGAWAHDAHALSSTRGAVQGGLGGSIRIPPQDPTLGPTELRSPPRPTPRQAGLSQTQGRKEVPQPPCLPVTQEKTQAGRPHQHQRPSLLPWGPVLWPVPGRGAWGIWLRTGYRGAASHSPLTDTLAPPTWPQPRPPVLWRRTHPGPPCPLGACG